MQPSGAVVAAACGTGVGQPVSGRPATRQARASAGTNGTPERSGTPSPRQGDVMKAVVLAVLAATLPLVARAAVPEQVRFTGVVVSDDAVAVNFDLVVPRGKRAALELDNGTRLELDTRGVAPDGEGARMRLRALDGRGNYPARNHEPAA